MIDDYRVKLGACLLVVTLAYMAYLERDQIKAAWRATVGAWFARRRMYPRIERPDEHSRGIMVSRRDINTGAWT